MEGRAAMCGEEAHTGHRRPPRSGPRSWQWDEDQSAQEAGASFYLPRTTPTRTHVGRRGCLLSRGVLIPGRVPRLALHRHVSLHAFAGIYLNGEERAACTTFPSARGREGMAAVGGRCEGQDRQPLGAARLAAHQPKPDTATTSSSPRGCARRCWPRGSELLESREGVMFTFCKPGRALPAR